MHDLFRIFSTFISVSLTAARLAAAMLLHRASYAVAASENADSADRNASTGWIRAAIEQRLLARRKIELLRTWCELVGQQPAVESFDHAVLESGVNRDRFQST